MPEAFGLCLQPSSRSAAYVRVLEALGLRPSWIMTLADAYGVRPELAAEARRHGYALDYFDPDVDFEAWLEGAGVPVIRTAAASMNAAEVVQALRRCPCDWVVYTGGGIVKDEALTAGPRFLHVHPGLTPAYRGSTCFYYSLLAGHGLGATAFFLEPGLDEGPVVAQAAFSANLTIGPDQPLFMDHVLDPWIRSRLLHRVLSIWRREGTLRAVSQPKSANVAYYVMHPALRSLCVLKLNERYDPAARRGVHAVDRMVSHGQ